MPYEGKAGGLGNVGIAASVIMLAKGRTKSKSKAHSRSSSSLVKSTSSRGQSFSNTPAAERSSNLRMTEVRRVELYRMNGAEASSKSVIFAMSKLICVMQLTDKSAYFIAAVDTSCVTVSNISAEMTSPFSLYFLSIFSRMTVLRSSYKSSANK